MERSLDRSVVSESILKSIDLNKLHNPTFELITSEWKVPDSADSTVPAKRGLENLSKTRNLRFRSPSCVCP